MVHELAQVARLHKINDMKNVPNGMRDVKYDLNL
jgi:hypothetical protein